MTKAIDLSPAAVIVSTLIGGSLAGFAGALLALPVTAMAKVMVKEVVRRRDEAHAAETSPVQEAVQTEPDV